MRYLLLFLGWMGMLFCQAALAPVGGQVVATTQSTPQVSRVDAAVQAYAAQQLSLMQQRQALVAQGATPVQLQAWDDQNASVIAQQQKRAVALSIVASLQSSSANQAATVPANASQTMKDFLATQSTLANVRAAIHNQQVKAMAATATADQISTMQQGELQSFRQQYAAQVQLQLQRAQALTVEANQVAMPLPSAPKIAVNSTPEAAAYQAQLYQFSLSHAQVWNRFLNADQTVRAAALQAWWKQNSDQVEQLLETQDSISADTSSQD